MIQMEALKKMKKVDSDLKKIDFEIMEKFINELEGIEKENLQLITAGIFLDSSLNKKTKIMKLINIFKGEDK